MVTDIRSVRLKSTVRLAMSLAVTMATLVFAVHASARTVDAGWARGGNERGYDYGSEYAADEALAANATECGSNTVLLFRVRGSGERYDGRDRLRQWATASGHALINKGWRVRSLQAIYPAPTVPIAEAGRAAARLNPLAVILAVKRFRDAASRSWPQVKTKLVQSARRCPQRKIVLSGYSQGAIILRYVLPRLPAEIRGRILAVDLVADPTADAQVDKHTRTTGPSARRTLEGLDTFGARSLNPFFRQMPFPRIGTDSARRVTQYCKSYDIVCDANPRTLLPGRWLKEGAIHASYAWAEIGRATAARIPRIAAFVAPQAPTADISAGGGHTCLRSQAGVVRCWGENFYGALGRGFGGLGTSLPDGSLMDQPGETPSTVQLGGAAVMVRTGGIHTCALTEVFAVLCWGGNSSGQVRPGAGSIEPTPSTVPLGGPVASISAGSGHTCAVTQVGAVRCWGSNDSGALGAGSTENLLDDPGESPSTVPLDGPVAGVSGGGLHTCALTPAGMVRCWGYNRSGQLGTGTNEYLMDQPGEMPSTVSLDGPAMAISAGGFHNCALTPARAVRCWGYNLYGQLGTGSIEDLMDQPAETPSTVPLGGPVAAISAGLAHTCALMEEGAVRCWGSNEYGELGTGSTDHLMDEPGEKPSIVPLGGPAVAISAGANYTCALTKAGAVRCWGRNGAGGLGAGSTEDLMDEPGEASSVVRVN